MAPRAAVVMHPTRCPRPHAEQRPRRPQVACTPACGPRPRGRAPPVTIASGLDPLMTDAARKPRRRAVLPGGSRISPRSDREPDGPSDADWEATLAGTPRALPRPAERRHWSGRGGAIFARPGTRREGSASARRPKRDRFRGPAVRVEASCFPALSLRRRSTTHFDDALAAPEASPARRAGDLWEVRRATLSRRPLHGHIRGRRGRCGSPREAPRWLPAPSMTRRSRERLTPRAGSQPEPSEALVLFSRRRALYTNSPPSSERPTSRRGRPGVGARRSRERFAPRRLRSGFGTISARQEVRVEG